MTGAVVVGGKKQVPHRAFARFGMTSLLRRFGMTKDTEPVRNDRTADRYFWAAGQPGAAVPTFATREAARNIDRRRKHGRSLAPLVKARGFGMTPSRAVEH
jgi:hypothetical protein